MLRRLIVLAILLEWSSAVSAQVNFKPGYILTKQGDTLRGLLDERSWAKNSSDIAFRENSEAKVKNFTPENSMGFGIGTDIYKAANVHVEIGPEAALVYKNTTVFLKTVIDGPKSLYTFRYSDGRDRFYIGGSSDPELLIYKKYDLVKNGQKFDGENKRFIGQLNLYLSDCPSIQKYLKEAIYREDVLKDIFLGYYNDCSSVVQIQSGAVQSGRNFEPGYVITKQGDTLRGLVDERSWTRNAGIIAFRKSVAATVKEFTPDNATGFGVGNNHYKASSVQVEIGPEAPLVYTNTTVFLKIIIEGSKSLYTFQYTDGYNRFYIEGSNGPELLIYKQYDLFQNGQKYTGENKRFIGQLTLYLSDCPAIGGLLKDAVYKDNVLEKIFVRYYSKCSSSPIKTQATILKGGVEFGATAGVAFASVSFSSGNTIDHPEILGTSYSNSTGPAVGLSFNIFLAAQRRVTINNDLLYTSYKFAGTYKNELNSSQYTTTYTRFGFGYIKLTDMVQYRFPPGDNHVFISLGISNAIMVSEDNYRNTINHGYGVAKPGEQPALNELKKWETGLVAGIGFQLKPVTLELRWEGTEGFSAYGDLTSRVNRTYLLFTYRINKVK